MMNIKSVAKVATKFLVNADTFLLLCIGSLSVAIFTISYTFPPEAALFPKAVSAFTFILIVSELVVQYKNKGKTKDGIESTEDKEELLEEIESDNNWLVVLIFSTLYYVLMKSIGFYPITVVYLLITPWVLGYRNKKVIVLTAIITTIIIWFVFGRLFYVPFPKGIFV